jgi:hypothetical protein
MVAQEFLGLNHHRSMHWEHQHHRAIVEIVTVSETSPPMPQYTYRRTGVNLALRPAATVALPMPPTRHRPVGRRCLVHEIGKPPGHRP